ncbi:MAG: small multi-drug export protein [Fervidicoccaceae archaeon]
MVSPDRAMAILLLSLAPGFEGRYAVLTALAMGLEPAAALLLASLGTAVLALALPVSLDRLERAILRRKRLNSIGRLYEKYVESTRRRISPYVNRYGPLGLALFVALPLPLTGLWSGAIAASVLGMDRARAALALLTGGLAAELVVLLPLAALKSH